MKLEKAKEISTNLKAFLTNSFWGDVYYLLQNQLLPEKDWEYDVYVEYHGEFNIERFSKLLNYLGGLTYTLAIPTRQIIIW